MHMNHWIAEQPAELTDHFFRSYATGKEARHWQEVQDTAVEEDQLVKRWISRRSSGPIDTARIFEKSTVYAGGLNFSSGADHTTGHKGSFRTQAERIATSAIFNSMIASFVFINAITLGVQTDYMAANKERSQVPTAFRVTEFTFCVIFTLEIMLKLYAHRLWYFKMPGRSWNVFDFLLVTFQVTELVLESLVDVSFSNLSAMRVLRILRVVRIIRVMRLLRMISELRAIVASVLGSMRALIWTVLLLFAIIYIISVYLTQLLIEQRQSGNPDLKDFNRYYDCIARSMLTLYQSVSGGIDWNQAVKPLIESVSPAFGFFFGLYIAFTVLAIMNVVTGVFVESALQSAREDKDIYIVNHIRSLVDNMMPDKDGSIHWETFEAQLENRDMQEVFRVIDVDMKEAAGLFRLLDLNGNGVVDSEEFLDGCLRLRGPAKALDLALLMREIKGISVVQHAQANALNQLHSALRTVKDQDVFLRHAGNAKDDCAKLDTKLERQGSNSSVKSKTSAISILSA